MTTPENEFESTEETTSAGDFADAVDAGAEAAQDAAEQEVVEEAAEEDAEHDRDAVHRETAQRLDDLLVAVELGGVWGWVRQRLHLVSGGPCVGEDGGEFGEQVRWCGGGSEHECG